MTAVCKNSPVRGLPQNLWFCGTAQRQSLCSWGLGKCPQQAKLKISLRRIFNFEPFVHTKALLATECITEKIAYILLIVKRLDLLLWVVI